MASSGARKPFRPAERTHEDYIEGLESTVLENMAQIESLAKELEYVKATCQEQLEQ